DVFPSRTLCAPRDLPRELASIEGQPVVAVFDAELATDDGFPLEDIYTKLRNLPLLVLLQADSESALPADAQRNTREEFARKPITASVLALRIKALVLAAGLPLPIAATTLVTTQGPLDLRADDPRG